MLRSNDIRDDPKYYPNYLDHPDDMRQMIKLIGLVKDLVKTEVMQRYGVSRLLGLVPDCEQLTGEAYDECSVRILSSDYWHYVGTAKMGPLSDPMAVVDHRLKV